MGSGVVIELDEPAWKITAALAEGIPFSEVRLLFDGEYSIQKLDRALRELSKLHDAGELFSVDPSPEPPDCTGGPVANLCLILARDCNLRCEYCYADGGSFAGKRSLMSEDTAKEAVDFLFSRAGSVIDLSISYFGGEPLLNFPVLSTTTEYALDQAKTHKKNIRFNITTNATLLNKKVRNFLSKHPEIFLIFSMDGGAETHNRYRRFANGRGSYEAVHRNVRSFFEDKRLDPRRSSVRGTFTGVDHDFINAVIELLELGSKDLSIEPAILRGTKLEIKEEQLPAIQKEYDRVALFFLEKIKGGEPFTFFHFQRAIDHVAFAEPMCKTCGAGVGYLAADLDGSLFPCHRFVGDKHFAMGNIWDGITDEHLRALFGKIHVNNKEKCRICWAKYHCGGGCHRHAIEFNNDIHEPYEIECELIKCRIELGAYIYAELTEEEKGEIQLFGPDLMECRPEFTYVSE
ncbi:MAG: SPASM domain-containing protein [Proteobacteria bacterium]|nr:SPASM domain-containing protein [Pseudomonadota bacterium]